MSCPHSDSGDRHPARPRPGDTDVARRAVDAIAIVDNTPATAVRQRTLSCTLSTAAVKAWSKSTASGSVP